jgi:hypothetical protein
VNGLAAEIGYQAFQSFPADDTAAIARFISGLAVPGRLTRAEPLSVVLPRFEATLADIVDAATRCPPEAGEVR